jgi:hypothetical protein
LPKFLPGSNKLIYCGSSSATLFLPTVIMCGTGTGSYTWIRNFSKKYKTLPGSTRRSNENHV